jgi:hypothetical protein
MMMHLSLSPKYDISEEPSISYDHPSTQTSNITSLRGSWCTLTEFTRGMFRTDNDEKKEDD